ncbi:MAG: hypothetical protein EP330_31215 [Deltaproteobacteria bacterium]|nr:MAG: hypothetical protein EP330_31215 [Deltaproteobacteria bacterium]
MTPPAKFLLFCVLLAACAGRPVEDTAPRCVPTEEVPYNGLDEDCDGIDIIDVDGDGFPGIDLDNYTGVGGTWPALGTELDCNDRDPEIFPGSPFEVGYDGIDSDCDGMPDYDVDLDGFVPTRNPNTGLPHDPPYVGPLPQGDCDDTDAQVNPGRLARDDQAYDGIDLNCDCSPGEFDADGDGFAPDQATYGAAYAAYDAAYFCELGEASWGDCDDGDATRSPGNGC